MVNQVPFVPVTVREESLVQDSLGVVKVVRSQWDFTNVKSKMFTDGITNKLIGFFLDDRQDQEIVMIKIYGQKTEMMIDREAEINTMTLLHEKDCGPELYAIFENGICYEFIQGSTLTMETCRSPKVYPIVAAEMARVHSTIPANGDNAISGGTLTCKMWDKMHTFNNLVKDTLSTNLGLLERLKSYGISGPDFGTTAITEMETILDAQGIPITFCHNDLLLGNIIYNPKSCKVSFIDFEYAMSNFFTFDIANHFNEFAGIENPDFSKCPDEDFKSAWIAEYIKNFDGNDIKLEKGVVEYWVELCMPASHLFWCLWAIVQAHNSTIDFDFAGYFGLRYVEYKKQMKEIRKEL